MEDQRSDAGDLSDPAVARRHRLPRGKARRLATAVPAAAEPPSGETDTDERAAESESAVLESAVLESAVLESAEPEAAAEADAAVQPRKVVFVERRPPGKRAPIAIGVAAALFVGAARFAGAALYPYLVDQASAATKFEIASTAANAITTLWTYTPDNMEQLADRSSKFLGGDFRNEYSKYIDAIVPTNKQAQVTNNTEVVGAAVESLNGQDATAIVYTNSTSTSPLTKNIPSMRYLSYRLTLHRDGPQWLVTGMTAITNLDLTPKI